MSDLQNCKRIKVRLFPAIESGYPLQQLQQTDTAGFVWEAPLGMSGQGSGDKHLVNPYPVPGI